MRVVLALAAVLLLTAGCGGRGDDAAGTPEDPDRIRIVVSNYPLAYGLPYRVAMREGIFARHGIEIEKVIASSGGGTSVRSLLAGDLTFGDVASTSALQAAGKGAPLRIIGGGTRGIEDTCIVTRPDAGIDSVADLRGKSAGYSQPGSITDAIMRLVLQDEGLSDSVELKSTGGLSEGLVLLAQGDIDAMPLAEPLCTLQKETTKRLAGGADYVPEFQQTVIAASEEQLERDPALARRFLAALDEANAWIEANPEPSAEILAQAAEIPPEVGRAVMPTLVEPMHWGVGLSGPGLARAVEAGGLSGIVDPDAVDWDAVLDPRFLPDGIPPANPQEPR